MKKGVFIKLKSRLIETILIIIGMLVFAFFGAQGVGMIIVHLDDEATLELYESYDEEYREQEETVENRPSLETFQSNLRAGGILILLLALTTMAAGGFSIYFLRKNMRPRIIGMLLLVVGFLIAVIGFAPAMIGSLMYLIAGTIIVVRKPKLQV